LDKNELNEQIQWMLGMAKTLETTLMKETLTSVDYEYILEAADGIAVMAAKAHNNQFNSK
jgi:hypothetical protein